MSQTTFNPVVIKKGPNVKNPCVYLFLKKKRDPFFTPTLVLFEVFHPFLYVSSSFNVRCKPPSYCPSLVFQFHFRPTPVHYFLVVTGRFFEPERGNTLHPRQSLKCCFLRFCSRPSVFLVRSSTISLPSFSFPQSFPIVQFSSMLPY